MTTAPTASTETLTDKLCGVPVFAGTRVPVYALIENLEDGATIDDFLEWFPGVTRRQVETVLDAAADHWQKAQG